MIGGCSKGHFAWTRHLSCTDMSSPSKPLSIGSPRPRQPIDDGDDENIVYTPDLRQLRQQFGTPPVGTTIPPFRNPGSLSHTAIGSPLRPSSAAGARSHGTGTPLETADVPALGDDEKIKILRKHLVSREGRMGHSENTSRLSSRRPSVHESQGQSRHETRPSTPGPSQPNSSPFPIPYHAPGGDITYVCVIPRRIMFTELYASLQA
jgi:solute carrier family 36 (proton-coupled amino acid transporter)